MRTDKFFNPNLVISNFAILNILPVCPWVNPGGQANKQHLDFNRFKLLTNKKLRPY